MAFEDQREKLVIAQRNLLQASDMSTRRIHGLERVRVAVIRVARTLTPLRVHTSTHSHALACTLRRIALSAT